MTTSFHATLARIAAYRATMLVEPLLGCPLGIDAHDVLAHNIQVGHPESAMTIADALVRSYDPTGQVFRGYSYDRVMDEVPAAVIERSARRALAVVPFGAVLDEQQADILRGAIAVELSYLWLKATERFYEDLAGDQPAQSSDRASADPTLPPVNPLRDALQRIATASVRSTNTRDAGDALSRCRAIAETALATAPEHAEQLRAELRRKDDALKLADRRLHDDGYSVTDTVTAAIRAALGPEAVAGGGKAEAWRWTAKGDSEPFLRLSGAPMHVGGDVVAVKPLFA